MLSFLYQNSKDFCILCHTDDFINCLFSVLIPPSNCENALQSEDQVATSILSAAQSGKVVSLTFRYSDFFYIISHIKI